MKGKFSPHHSDALRHFFQDLEKYTSPPAIDYEAILSSGSGPSDKEVSYVSMVEVYLRERSKARVCERALDHMHPADVNILRTAYSAVEGVPSMLVAFSSPEVAAIMLERRRAEDLTRLCQRAAANDAGAIKDLKRRREQAEKILKEAQQRFAAAWDFAQAEKRPSKPYEGSRLGK